MSTEQPISNQEEVASEEGVEPRRLGPFTVRRWLMIAFFAVLILFMMRPVLDPYGEKGYMEISHGDHTHYLPRDRDPNVSVSNFPTTPPGPNERILPDGRVVPK